MTVEEVKKVIDQFFSDSSREACDTLDGLYDIRDDLDMKVEALESDLDI